MRAPEIESYAFQANEFKEFSLSSLLGKPVMLIFYPMDFGYIAPSELTLVQKLMQDEQIVAISTGSVLSKYKWAMTSLHKGGIKGIEFPLVADLDGSISAKYGVLHQKKGYSYRAFIIVDSEGFITCRYMSDLSIGLGINEGLRMYAASLVGCTPPNWTKGQQSTPVQFFMQKHFDQRLEGGSSPAEDRAVVPDNQSADQKQERNDSNLTRRNSDGSSKKQPRSRKISDTKIAEELPITTTTTSNTLASNIVNTSSAVPGTSLNTPEPLNNDVDISTDETKGSDLIFNFEILGWNIYDIY